MDPLFERRELTKKVHIHAKYIQRNIQSSLLAQLKNNYQGKCLAKQGYIHPDSFTILKYSLGRTNMIKGGVDYNVTFQADICLPHPGQLFRGSVSLKSKIGLHVDLTPLKVLIPRDLDNVGFEKTQQGEEIEFQVIGSQFNQGDEEIIIVAKLIGQSEEEAKEGGAIVDIAPIPKQQTSGGEVMQIIINPVQADEKPKKRKLKRSEDV